MKISEIDKNLTVYVTLPEDVEWFDVRQEPFKIYGLLDYGEEGFRRLPEEVSKPISQALFELSCHTAGGRARFKTDSPYVAVKAAFNTKPGLMSHMAFINSAGFDVYLNTENNSRYAGTITAPWDFKSSFANICWPGNGLKDLTLNFPSYGGPSQILIGLKKGSVLLPSDGYRDADPIVFYGSSITQGGCASRPGLIYENYISRKYNIDYVNLGFSGNGLAEESVVDYMATLPMSVFVSDYDHNAPTAEHLQKTHYRMYEKIRAAHPNIPYIMISKPDFDSDSNAYLRREIIFESYMKARKNGDWNVYFIDGKRLFQGDHRDCCTVDGCHPNDLGMCRFADALIGEMDNFM